MGKYEEDVYGRAEFQFKNIDGQISWLASFDDKTGAYAEAAVKVANELATSVKLIEEAKETKTIRSLGNIETKANKITYGNEEVLVEINERTRILEGEANELANTIKQSRSFSELDEAIENLRELNPQKLGGIKSGQVRFRGSQKEQKQIGEALGFVFGD